MQKVMRVGSIVVTTKRMAATPITTEATIAAVLSTPSKSSMIPAKKRKRDRRRMSGSVLRTVKTCHFCMPSLLMKRIPR
jgi:hypothetical protein